jgi:hypothetical protein
MMKILCILLIAWTGLAMPLQVRAQRFQYSIQLQEVTFLDGESTPNLFPIKKDDGSGLYVNSGQPHWTQTQSVFTKIPIAYQSGTKPRVTAKFTLECTQPIGNQVKMRGIVRNPDNQEEVITKFEELDISVSSTGHGMYNLLYKRGKGVEAFKKKIRYIRLYSIDWEISFDNGTNWSVVEDNNNSNINELYVTWKKPLEEYVGVYEHVHTLFHLSCKANDNFETSLSSDIFTNLWQLFNSSTNRVDNNYNLLRRDGASLVYYKTFDPLSRNSFELIKNLDGQCFAFTSLLLHLCRIQGINYDDAAVTVLPELNPVQECGGNMSNLVQSDAKFMVANWKFKEPLCRTDCNKFPFVATYDLQYRVLPYVINPNRYYFAYTEVDDKEGAAGQNSSNPTSYFQSHALIKLNNIIYDPSYGNIYNSLQDLRNYISGWAYERQNVTESYLGRDLNNNGNLNDSFNALFIASEIQVNQFKLQ